MEEFVYVGNGQRVPRDVVSVRFDPSVTEVERDAFQHCNILREVVFNDSLQKIGKYAFASCTSLDDITIPPTVTEIGGCAFYNCTSLKEVVMNEGIQKIGISAFNSCRSLVAISLPSTVTEIGGSAFHDCSSLREVRLNEGLQKIGDTAFENCTPLQIITIPSTLTEIGNYAFVNCNSLQEVVIQERLEKIGQAAFGHCHLLKRFNFLAISTRLSNVIEVETEANRIRRFNEIDIARRGSELFVPGAVLRGGSSWNTVKASLDNLVSWIRYHEIKEETTLFELALWKARLDQADGATDINRDAYRIEMPGPVKEAILKYL